MLMKIGTIDNIYLYRCCAEVRRTFAPTFPKIWPPLRTRLLALAGSQDKELAIVPKSIVHYVQCSLCFNVVTSEQYDRVQHA